VNLCVKVTLHLLNSSKFQHTDSTDATMDFL